MRDLEEIQKEALKCNSISRNLQIVLYILLVIQFAILVYWGMTKVTTPIVREQVREMKEVTD